MNFKNWLLYEMPINQAQLLGKWDQFPPNAKKSDNWDKASFNILNRANQSNFEKLKLSWEKTPQTFDLYFFKNKGTRATREEGEVDINYLKNLGINVPINPANITVVYTNNIGDEKMPMTPWITAHRFAHSIVRSKSVGRSYEVKQSIIRRDFSDLFEETFNINKGSPRFEPYLDKFIYSIATMRSATTNSIPRFGELFHELLAQFLIEGKIRYKKTLPRSLSLQMAWGRPRDMVSTNVPKTDEIYLQELEYRLEYFEDYHSNLMNQLLQDCVGKIFVI